ncbi:hypothetical protein WH47_11742 [Habropoda laboriosa]|uniref:Uncharacterized protein n=1 Tax=Habropoda laboriosa TaxID=597456 RepID=A0A0L7R8C0_9HYME|nr:PREDICTED: uncharacterized protein LOC108570827 [Habropoda laboriosa]XP_017788233.1 PREDICTED: uncharacterized protein LOC108570827 [Habropoda laboriosa]XP_017788234.1 PREDICTED: uncharacterized protein LOC108570827 [Habropoda laboriosa]XP_017788237.1 PREDICTED: uncharacterized protein LOC108570827 [Habropoda laboriosa]XP_017788238.1 PREDICTED: uncharacterized protein LOC108570827 [Habropoda laboriosa]KOC67089.1 hypothetical protein WH47_11742 [Habropoda laboriosa]
MVPSSRLLQDEPADSATETSPRNPPDRPTTLPSIVIEDVGGNDDDPPPYSAVVPPDHVGWPFNFPAIPYSACTTTSCRTEAAPLADFQTNPTSPGSDFHPEGTDSQHASISMPLMPYRLLMFGSRRSLFTHGGLPFSDNISVRKDGNGRTRKYGAILVGAAVITFLMALSLLVRFVMDRNLWRG